MDAPATSAQKRVPTVLLTAALGACLAAHGACTTDRAPSTSAAASEAPARPGAASPTSPAPSAPAGEIAGSPETDAPAPPPRELPDAPPIGGIDWEHPEGARVMPGMNPMRLIEYHVDTETGTVIIAVFFLGTVTRPIDDILDRWNAEFDGVAQADAQRSTREHRGVELSTIRITGTHHGGHAMPGADVPAQAPDPSRPDERLLGACVRGPGGVVAIKTRGLLSDMDEVEPVFEALIHSIRRAGIGNGALPSE